ncbi:MAG: helix-turn-helix transcriptional regulator [Pirellulales bacterium]|nr:helix-turn-helix transcriptional regulator [Pirellulales bacterium]
MKDLIAPGLHETSVISQEYPVLENFGISWTGYTSIGGSAVRKSDEFDRRFGHIQITVSGDIEVLVDGGWIQLPPNTGYVTPPGADWAWRHKASQSVWKVIFVRFVPGPLSPIPADRQDSYLLTDCFTDDLLGTYKLLYRESITVGRPTVMRCLGELMGFHARQIISRTEPTNQLAPLWMEVAADLARPWNLNMLCSLAHMSPEKLRLLCRAETGHSPMRFVNRLRMRHAAALLRETHQGVSEISRQVGYEDPFNFSTSFKRCYGHSPREFRKGACG